MKKRLSSLTIAFLVLLSVMSANIVAFAAESLGVVSSCYQVTYNDADYDNQNTIKNIPANTNANIFLYNMEKDNSDYVFSIKSSSGSSLNSWENISNYSDRRTTLTVKQENNGESEQFILIPENYSEIDDDFEKYPLGEFMTNSLWAESKTTANFGNAYICDDTSENRFHRFSSPVAGDSDYSEADAKSDADEKAIILTSAHIGVSKGEKAELKFKIRKNNSAIQVMLRDTNTSSENHYLTPINSLRTDEKVTCFASTTYAKDASGNDVICPNEQWNEFKIIFDRENQDDTKNKIEVYINNSENAVASSKFSSYSNFIWEDFRVIFAPSVSLDAASRTDIDIDDFSFTKEENDGAFKVNEVNTYKKSDDGLYEYAGQLINGTNTFKVTLKNNTNSIKPVYVIFAEKNKDALVGVKITEASAVGGEKTYTSLEMEVEDAVSNNVEIYVWEKDKLIPVNNTFKPEIAEVSNAIAKGHPRVLADSLVFDRIRNSKDAKLLEWKNTVVSYADEIIDGFLAIDADSDFYIGNGIDLQKASNRTKSMTVVLSMAYQITEDEKYAGKLYDVLMKASEHSGFTPGDDEFTNLNVAYMTESFAIGYDWCYSALSDEQKQDLANIVIDRCFDFALSEYENVKRGSHTWSVTYTNWNGITNSSFITGSLAFAECSPELCQKIFDYSTERLKIFLSGFAPDGGWWEGMMYVPLLHSHFSKASETLKICLGEDSVIAGNDFYKKSAEFVVGVTGPCGTHNFAEQKGVKTDAEPEILWLAKISGEKDIVSWALDTIDFTSAKNCALSLLWYTGEDDSSSYSFKNYYARAVEHITLGNGNKGEASWLSVLGGENMGQHKHLDLGSFIYDYNGVRWAMEFGSDEYYKGYQNETSAGKIFYRARAEGHNTLEINPSSLSGGQRMTDSDGVSEGKVISYNLREDKPYAVYDLTSAYSDNASSVKRGFRLLDNNIGFIVRDEFTTKNTSDIVNWYMHTEADIQILDDGKSALLTKGGKTMKVTVLEDGLTLTKTKAFTPEEIYDELLSISTNKGWQLNRQYKNEGYEKLKITSTGSGSITVMVAPTDIELPSNANDTLNTWE